MSGHEGASFYLHISLSAFASRTQSGGTTSGPARLVREDQKVVAGSAHCAAAHLLGSVMLVPGARLWTRDKRLLRAAEERGVSFTEGTTC